MRAVIPLAIAATFLSVTDAARKHFNVARRAANRTDIPMYYENGTPYSDVSVGGQSFRVVFDTGSPVTWVPSVSCRSTDCDGRDVYDPKQSDTAVNLHQKASIDFGGDMCIDAHLYNDTVVLSKDVVIESALVAAAYHVRGFEDSPYLGSLGLGGTDSASTLSILGGSTKSGFLRKRDILAGIGLYSVPTFGFSIVVGAGGGPLKRRNNVPNGVFTIGDLDSSLYKGEIYYTPIPPESYGPLRFWKTPLSCAKVGKLVDLKFQPDTHASFASAVATITGPTADTDALHDGIGATYDEESGTYRLKCCNARKLPELTFTLQGFTIHLPAETWTAPVDEHDTGKEAMCYTKIGRNNLDIGTDWAFGNSFLEPFYHIYDTENGQIGLARRIDDQSNITFST